MIKIPPKLKKALIIIAIIVLGLKLLYKIGGGAFLETKVNRVVAKEISDFITEDIPNLKFNKENFYNKTLTINFLLFNPDESKYDDIRKKVDEKACFIINNNQPHLEAFNININTSRNNKFVYSYVYRANNCV